MKSTEKLVHKDSNYYLYNPSNSAKELYFFPTSLGFFKYEAGYHLKRNNFKSFLIAYIQKGEFYLKHEDINIPIKEGQIMLVDCFVPHEYGCHQSCEVLWLHFGGPLAVQYYELISSKFGNVIQPKDKNTVQYSLQKMLSSFQNRETIEEARLSKFIVLMLTELIIADSNINTKENEKSLAIKNTITYINDHFNEPITLDSLAKMAALSPFYYSRTFTKETGMPPHQYLIETRIRAAKFMLKATTQSIKEIAFSTGFQSETSFCTTFKKKEKITPSHYRSIGSLR